MVRTFGVAGAYPQGPVSNSERRKGVFALVDSPQEPREAASIEAPALRCHRATWAFVPGPSASRSAPAAGGRGSQYVH